jgi:hypothetical protein
MRNHKLTEPNSTSILTAMCYVVTLLTVVGVTFWFTKIVFIELGQHLRFIYPPYGI